MFWQEDEDKTLPYQVPDDVVDVGYALQCKRLPPDHAWTLSQAVQAALPWLADEPLAGIHTIHVADSGNGWERPGEPGQYLIPSRRTRLFLRLPHHRVAEADTLTGKTLDIAGNALTVGESRVKPFLNASVLFARYVLCGKNEDEHAFLVRMAAEIHTIAGVRVKKMLCGKSHDIATPAGMLHTRYLMVADLDSEPSIRLQQQGLGEGRKLGCGLLLPHKGIKTLKPTE